MIAASGSRPGDDAPMVLVGLDQATAVQVLAGQAVYLDTEHINPLLPPMRIVISAGGSDADLVAALQARWPNIWVMPR